MYNDIQKARRLAKITANLKQIGLALHAYSTSQRVFPPSSIAVQPVKLSFDTYSGYFVSNKFEPDAAESFLVIDDQKQFDKVFGVAMVMGDKSHRLPKEIFSGSIVLAAVKRGKAVCEFKVDEVTVAGGVVELRYAAGSKQSDSATFASPLIVSIPRGPYTAVRFWENGKMVKETRLLSR